MVRFYFLIFLFFFLRMHLVSAAPSCQTKNPPRYVGNQRCYDPTMFDTIGSSKKPMVPQFAPIALYLQEITGFPASVIIAQKVKEQGWKAKAPGNNHYGMRGKCPARAGNESFQTPAGYSVSFQTSACSSGSNKKYPTTRDSIFSYVHLLLYKKGASASYNRIRSQITGAFPTPGLGDRVVDAISKSNYCASGCQCQINNKWQSYGTCMKSHIRSGCLAELDNMILCEYNYEGLEGLALLRKNIRPSNIKGQGRSTIVDPGRVNGGTIEEVSK